jgi:hypothetical protein
VRTDQLHTDRRVGWSRCRAISKLTMTLVTPAKGSTCALARTAARESLRRPRTCRIFPSCWQARSMIRRPAPVDGNLLRQRPTMVPRGHGAKAPRKDAGMIRLVKARKKSDPPSTAKRRRDLGDDESLPVIVPRSDKVLVATSAARVRRLREHLRAALHTMKDPKCSTSPLRPEPEGFAARVARTACSLCRGWCCRNGGDDGFLDDRTMARVRIARPDMDARAVLRLYIDRVPEAVYKDSCIFHGKRGCTLDRSLRADVCNSYFCGGLGTYMRMRTAVPQRIIAGESDKMRTSPVLVP